MVLKRRYKLLLVSLATVIMLATLSFLVVRYFNKPVYAQPEMILIFPAGMTPFTYEQTNCQQYDNCGRWICVTDAGAYVTCTPRYLPTTDEAR